MKFHLVANPASGRGKGTRHGAIASEILRRNGHEVTFFQGASETESRDFIEQSLGHCDALVVAGGDGMVHLAIQTLAGTDTPLGIIPSGTGNDAARSLGLPLKSAVDATRIVMSAHYRHVDLGRVEGGEGSRWFLQILSTGFDSEVNERANRYRWPKGPMKYNLAMLATLPRFTPIQYQIEDSDGRQNFEAMLVAIANGPSYGGGMLVCPDAAFDDGQLDLMVLHPVSKARFLTLFPRVYRGTHVLHPRVLTSRSSSLTISGKAVAYADGERIGSLPLRVEVVPSALRVIAPEIP